MKAILHFSIALLTLFVGGLALAQSSDLTVNFASPTNGQVMTAPLSLRVNASESAVSVLTVEYFVNGQSIGAVSNRPTIYPPPGGVIISTIHGSSPPLLPLIVYSPFNLFWNPQPGDYVLTAKATDDQGNTALSDPVNVTIIPTPVVTVEATAPVASPSGPGIFTISRTGETNSDLQVQYSLYRSSQRKKEDTISFDAVTIPAGQYSADVVIDPSDFPGKTKALILTINGSLIVGGPIPLNSPAVRTSSIVSLNPPYTVGWPGSAAVFIKATDGNRHTPWVKLVKPRNGDESFSFGSSIFLTADTLDRDTYVTKVEFFDGTTKITEALSSPVASPGKHLLFNAAWTNAPAGTHMLRALATDSQNGTRLSAPVQVNVLPAP